MGEINEGCGKKLESKLTQERRLRDMAWNSYIPIWTRILAITYTMIWGDIWSTYWGHFWAFYISFQILRSQESNISNSVKSELK